MRGVKPSAQSPLFNFPRTAVADRNANTIHPLTIDQSAGFSASFRFSTATAPIESLLYAVLLIEWPPVDVAYGDYILRPRYLNPSNSLRLSTNTASFG